MRCLPRIRDLIANRRTFLVGMEWCQYTLRAASKVLPSTPVIYLDDFSDSNEALDWLKNKYSHETVPFVFIEGRFVGGSEAL